MFPNWLNRTFCSEKKRCFVPIWWKQMLKWKFWFSSRLINFQEIQPHLSELAPILHLGQAFFLSCSTRVLLCTAISNRFSCPKNLSAIVLTLILHFIEKQTVQFRIFSSLKTSRLCSPQVWLSLTTTLCVHFPTMWQFSCLCSAYFWEFGPEFLS